MKAPAIDRKYLESDMETISFVRYPGFSKMHGTYSDKRMVMAFAHDLRKQAAMKYGCKYTEIFFGECLSMAWRAHKLLKGTDATFGWVSFSHRDVSRPGDRYSWAKVSRRTVTVSIAPQPMTTAYAEEMAAFCARFGAAVPARGQRVIINF